MKDNKRTTEDGATHAHVALLLLNGQQLLSLAHAFESGRLGSPFSGFDLKGLVPVEQRQAVSDTLNSLAATGIGAAGFAATLRLLAGKEAQVNAARNAACMVWTGPEMAGARSRDTSVVVPEVFGKARHRLLVSTYALYQAASIFEDVAARLEADRQFQFDLFLNIGRAKDDSRPADAIVAEFKETFRNSVWPGHRLPRVFYYPKALEPGWGKKACLHAKCIVADDHLAFISSANFTEAAQLRNIEAGVLLESREVATALRSQFESLVQAGVLVQLEFGG